MAISVWDKDVNVKIWDKKVSSIYNQNKIDYSEWVSTSYDVDYSWQDFVIEKASWDVEIKVRWAQWWNSNWWKWWFSKWKIRVLNKNLIVRVWWRWSQWKWWFNWWWIWSDSWWFWWGWATDVRIWWDTLNHRRIVAWWGWGWDTGWVWNWWWVWWWLTWWSVSSWKSNSSNGLWWSQTSWWWHQNSGSWNATDWTFWTWWHWTGWSWGSFAETWWWGWWYWWGGGIANGAWGWSWYVYTQSTEASAPSSYDKNSDYYLTEASTKWWWETFESVDWWTETGHTWNWYAKIEITWWRESINPTYITSPGAYHNPDLWLISISTDWENWITISDKNVWATVADPENTDSYWDIFQYWNIYHFDWEWSGWTVTTEAQIPDLTGYEWWNLYSNDKYRTNIDWNAANKKLWKPVAFANLLSLQKGPCDRWFHVPSAEEWTAVLNAILELEWEEAEFSYDLIARYLLMAHPNARKGDWDFYSSNTSIYFTNSYIANQNKINAFVMIWDEWDESGWLSATDMNCGGYIRWFRDVAMVPTTEWTKIGGWSTVRLPLEYQEVEYIEGTWTQYLNTGISAPNWFKAELRVAITAQVGQTLMGSHNVNSPYWRNNVNTFTSGATWGLHMNDEMINGLWSITFWQIYEMEICTRLWASYLTVDWVRLTTGTNASPMSSNNILLLQNQYWINRWDSCNKARIYSCKMYDDSETLIRDLVPCYRRIDWAVWMYDLANDQFYANAWTWAFLKWVDVNTPELPEQYTEVEYLQSNWQQYIDTWIDRNEILTPFIRYEFYSDTSSSDCWFLWDWTTWWYIFWESGNQYRFVAWWTQWWSSSWISYSTWRHTFMTNASNWYLDWTQGSWNPWNMTIYRGSIHLFRAANFWVPAWNVRVYSCLVWSSNDNLIHYYVPCFRNSDSKPGLYDLITKEFLVNGWTGEFTIWPRTKHAYQINENTKLYMPLTSEVRDLSWKATITNTWVTITNLNWVYCWNFNWSSRIETNISSFTNINHTLACWVKRNWWSNAWVICSNPCWIFNWDVIYPTWDNKYSYQSYHTTSGSGFSIESNTLNQSEWHFVIFTWWKLYVDWVLQWSNSWWYTWWQVYTIWWHTTNSSCTRQFLTWYIAEVIIEDWVWTEEQVIDYYNKTKSIFNIS